MHLAAPATDNLTAAPAGPAPAAAGPERFAGIDVAPFDSAQGESLDKAIFALLKRDDAWDGKLAVLTSVPGVATTTAAAHTLSEAEGLAELPDPFDSAQGGTLSRRAVASLAGLAALSVSRRVDHDSGTLKGRRFIRGGRAAVRVSLHMATLLNPPIKAMCQRLRAAGKPFRVAMVACARRLLTILNAMVRNDRHWELERACDT